MIPDRLEISKRPETPKDNLESLQTIQKIYRLSEAISNVWECVQTEKSEAKNSRKFCRFPDRPKGFQNVWKVSRQSGNVRFPDWLKSFVTTEKAHRQPGKLIDNS